ncbi:hypothetical protein IOS36_004474 [Salmonella enterica]|uniref:Eaa protein n=1 Tax=Salmonella enterica subsp. arizonae serovar 48:z4,z24:- TaxID=1967584 RepID=A0A738XFU5_SALER|nr:hypothetical protein [Salmonella enterica]EDR1779967.1 hypothetical protein [Salmonella enterica subsp. arizonae]EDW8070404.1 hypothetical protein [Salmonella enterica subsp. arizonae serovar 48:z4,z24:-]EDX3024020.1 hypothetical protein [Salmonella enterica subsp. houtenae serovar 48:g,z51:-]EAR4677298.1 hypothetical protein [Salmonella enterica]
MTTITRERLLKIQQWRETYGAGSNVMLPAEEAEELARIALAALEADPEPVVPESISVRQAISTLESADCVTTIGQAYKMGWNACRAAMLQGGQPVSNHDELPYAQVKAVADLYAPCWQSGEVVTYTPDPEKATIWLNNYSGTCVQEYVKLERLQEALAGNASIIPDGYALVPVEPTDEMIAAAMNCEDVLFNSDESFCVQYREIYCAMVDTAPALNKGEY